MRTKELIISVCHHAEYTFGVFKGLPSSFFKHIKITTTLQRVRFAGYCWSINNDQLLIQNLPISGPKLCPSGVDKNSCGKSKMYLGMDAPHKN